MSDIYKQKTCKVSEIAKTLNSIMDTIAEGAQIDMKIIPFENASLITICWREITGGGGGGGGESNVVIIPTSKNSMEADYDTVAAVLSEGKLPVLHFEDDGWHQYATFSSKTVYQGDLSYEFTQLLFDNGKVEYSVFVYTLKPDGSITEDSLTLE